MITGYSILQKNSSECSKKQEEKKKNNTKCFTSVKASPELFVIDLLTKKGQRGVKRQIFK